MPAEIPTPPVQFLIPLTLEGSGNAATFRSTLVCDHEAEAKQLGFGSKGERYKVVTKGGLLINKTGAMTGGGSGDFAAKAARFDQAHIQQLKQASHAKVLQDTKVPPLQLDAFSHALTGCLSWQGSTRKRFSGLVSSTSLPI